MLRLIISISALGTLAAPAPRENDLRRAVALLDYVAGDYARAVGPGGELLSADEHREQVGLLVEAVRELSPEAGAAELVARIEALRGRVEGRAAPAGVALEGRAIRDEIARRFGVAVLPAAPPDLARGARLFENACAACHVERRAEMKAVDFSAPAEVRALTPQRAFNSITYGVPGTSMPSWAEAFDDRARWDLAFHVLSVARPSSGEGRRLADAARLPRGHRELAPLSDEDLDARLRQAGLGEKERELALAAVRGGPFDGPPGPDRLGGARRGVEEAAELHRKGDRDGARKAALSAYLDGFEPHEPSLRARDKQLVTDIERAFLDFRAALQDAGGVERQAARLDGLLARAGESAPGGGAIAFLAALAIALREGIEAALIVAALLAVLRKGGREREAAAVHAGLATALAAGAVTWWLSGAVLRVSGLQRELIESVMQLLTAALLLYASQWLLAWAGSRRFVSALSGGGGGPAFVFAVAFGAIYREAFETVIFFRGLLLESPGAGGQVLGGALAGFALLALLVATFGRIGRRLKPRPLLVGCGIVFCGLAVVMVGNAARGFQEAGVLPLTVWTSLQLPALGVYGTREGLVAQAALLGALAVWAVAQRRKAAAAR